MSTLDQSNEGGMTRREALAWLARAAAVGCVSACGMAAHAGDDKPVKVTSLYALPHGKAKEFDKPPLILVRTDAGVAAFPKTCTHKHTDLAVDRAGNIYCPLHNSVFDLTGKPTGGPAKRALKWFKVTLDAAGFVYVNVKQSVEQGAWAPLPEWAKPKK